MSMGNAFASQFLYPVNVVERKFAALTETVHTPVGVSPHCLYKQIERPASISIIITININYDTLVHCQLRHSLLQGIFKSRIHNISCLCWFFVFLAVVVLYIHILYVSFGFGGGKCGNLLMMLLLPPLLLPPLLLLLL